nr:hypothetical protein [Desulfobacula sp.]
MFQSNESLSVDNFKEGYKNVVWDTSSGKVSFHGQWSKERVFCAKDNQLVYLEIATNEKQKSYTWYRGTLDNLNPYPPPDENMVIDREFDCVWEPNIDRWDKSGISYPWRYRLRGMNYLEFVERNIDPTPMPSYELMELDPKIRTKKNITDRTPFIEKALYYEQPGVAGIPLSVQFGGWSGCGLHSISYIEWKKAYFLYTSTYYDEYPIKAWWLTPQGKILEEKLPAKIPFLSASEISIYPVKSGFFIKIWGAQRPNAYLAKDGKMEALIEYPVLDVSISPDGCKAAFVHTTNIRKFGDGNDKDRTLKIIDFCKNEVRK